MQSNEESIKPMTQVPSASSSTASTPKLSRIESTCIPLNRNNVDTDQIIPARFLKGTTKAGLGEKLFADWRYDATGQAIPDFPLNNPTYQGSILVAAHNFGCGSSREHAPWALKDYGFQVIIAISFADIFCNNALKNQLLTIALPEPVVMNLLDAIEKDPNLTLTVDLPTQQVHIPGLPPQAFSVDPYRKTCLVEGLDDIGYTLQHLDAIRSYEQRLDA